MNHGNTGALMDGFLSRAKQAGVYGVGNSTNIIYHPSDYDDYYLTGNQVNSAIKTLRKQYGSTEKNESIFKFIAENEKLHRESLAGRTKEDVNKRMDGKNLAFRDKYRHWAHEGDAYKEFYNIINGGKEKDLKEKGLGQS